MDRILCLHSIEHRIHTWWAENHSLRWTSELKTSLEEHQNRKHTRTELQPWISALTSPTYRSSVLLTLLDRKPHLWAEHLTCWAHWTEHPTYWAPWTEHLTCWAPWTENTNGPRISTWAISWTDNSPPHGDFGHNYLNKTNATENMDVETNTFILEDKEAEYYYF